MSEHPSAHGPAPLPQPSDGHSQPGESLALVLRMPEQTLTGHGQELKALLQRDRLINQQHQEQELHHHRQIWTKDPYGGPYKKVAAKEHSSATATKMSLQVNIAQDVRPEDLLGYEVVDVGPTTNFVGNHMTKGAVDLVQAELSGLARRLPVRNAGRLPPRRHPNEVAEGSGPEGASHLLPAACGASAATAEGEHSEGWGTGLPGPASANPELLPARLSLEIGNPGNASAMRLLARQLMSVRDTGASRPPVRITP